MPKKEIFHSILAFAGLLVLSLAGCISAPIVAPPVALQNSSPGVYHRVEKGQTLWMISKMYGVDIDSIVKVNRISDAASIEVGQMVLIPDAKPILKINKKPVSFSSEGFSWPIQGQVISSFGQNSNGLISRGINIRPFGRSDNVLASRGGKVVFYDPGLMRYGKTVIVDHGDGFSTVYAGNSQVYVKVGDSLQKGGIIGRIDSSGDKAGSSLYFQVVKGHTPQNPYFYLAR